jgi:phosphatidylserine/phosphatidylglycerophosphate/cardiolipin synthase-like enzyme/uncharacterized membrane protein YdjX (TVP38/TMEM64 family)
MTFLIDAAQYFEAFASAVDQAERTIYIAAWDIDSRTPLRHLDDESEGAPVCLGEFLNKKVARTPGLQAYILCWDFAMLYVLEREWLPFFKLGWKTHRRVHFRLAGEHPTGASHHQKFVVVDDAVAFSGGIDLTKSRWDTSEHRIDDPRRIDPGGNPYSPFHDVQALVDGDAAASLGDLFRARWLRARGKKLGKGERAGPTPWPRQVEPDLRDVQVAISRTLPPYKSPSYVREVESSFLDSIRAAEKSIYMENQYLTAKPIIEALVERLRQKEGPEIVIVLPRESSGWLEKASMDSLRARALKRLLEADGKNRLRILHPVLPHDVPLYVHSKVMVVDDRLARVGSANLSNRSMGFDSECDLSVEARGDPTVAKGIASFKNRLLAEHLGVSLEKVSETLTETRSLIRTVELQSTEERSLKPLPWDPDLWIDPAAVVPDPSVLDPEKPIRLDQMIDQFVEDLQPESKKRHIVRIGVVLMFLLGLAVAWRWGPLSEWVRMPQVIEATASIKEAPFSLLYIAAGFVMGGLLMVPVMLLVGVTAMLFPPLSGMFYSLIGCLCSALMTYFIGRVLGRDAILKIAGARINRLNRRLAREGVLTVTVVRNLPIAPFTIVNMVAGASRIKVQDYLLGTAIGMAPGIIGITVFMDRLVVAIMDPFWGNIAAAMTVAFAVGLGIWWIRRRISKD